MQLVNQLVRFAQDNTGSTATEYAIIGSLISIVVIAAVSGIGSSVNETFTEVNSQL